VQKVKLAKVHLGRYIKAPADTTRQTKIKRNHNINTRTRTLQQKALQAFALLKRTRPGVQTRAHARALALLLQFG
jgi:hypothetical protein